MRMADARNITVNTALLLFIIITIIIVRRVVSGVARVRRRSVSTPGAYHLRGTEGAKLDSDKSKNIRTKCRLT